MLTDHTHWLSVVLVVLLSTSSGKWEVWGWTAICLFYLPTQPNTQCCKEVKINSSKHNDLPYCVQPGSVTSAFSPHTSQVKSHTSLRRKFQALHEGDYWYSSCKSTADWLLYARMSWRTGRREGEWLFVNPPPPSLLLLLTLSHSSLPPFLLPPSFYNSIPP